MSSSYDVQNIATHEFGHFHAGLEDIDDPAASEITMFAFGARGEVKKRSLAVSDVNSFARAYGPLNDAPVVTITEPDNGSIFNTGDENPINFKGNAIDTEDGDAGQAGVIDLGGISRFGGRAVATTLLGRADSIPAPDLCPQHPPLPGAGQSGSREL